MTTIVPIITALADAQTPRILSGKGAVEKISDDGTAVIAVGSGRMTVRLISGNLTQGDIVECKALGREVLIEKLNVPAAGAQGAPADAFEAFLPQSGADSSAPTSFLLETPIGPPPGNGYYSFPSMEDALKWASSSGANISEADARRLILIVNDTAVMAHVDEDESGVRRLTVMSAEKARAELLSFARTSLSNAVLVSPTGDTLEALLMKRGSLSIQRLLDIDRTLSETDASGLAPFAGEGARPGAAAPPSGGLSQDALKAISLQWLTIASDPAVKLSALPPLLPQSGAAALPQWFEQASSAPQSGSAPLFSQIDINKFAITGAAFDQSGPKERLLPGVARGLGLDFERRLLQGGPSGQAPEDPGVSLKSLVLETLDKSSFSVNEAALGLEKARGELENAIDRFAPVLLAQRGKTDDRGAQALQTLREEFGLRLESFGAKARELTTFALPSVEMPAQAAVRGMILHVEAVFNENLSRILSVITPAGESAATPTSGAAASLLPGNGSDELLKMIGELSDSIDRATREIPRHIESLLSPTSHLTDLSQSNASPRDMHATEGMRGLEAMAQRIESLQILAKPVSTAQGVEQIVLLPMKIDGQWNDVMMKFVKDKRQGGKKNGRRATSVELHVAPATLGAMNVTMDYSVNRDLMVHMYFDKDKARNWFEGNRAELTEAMGKLGFRTVHLTMQKKTHQVKATASVAALSSENNIDIVI